MAHAAHRLDEEQRVPTRRGGHLRVVEAPAGRSASTKSRKRGSAATGARKGAVKAGPVKADPKAKAARAATTARKSPAAAPRKPRSASMSADGLIAGATRAMMPERKPDAGLARTCRTAFQLFMIALVVVSAFGMARITLSAQAAATTVEAMKLERELKAAQAESERLELNRESLAGPSRIESAAVGIRLGRPATVRYIALPKALAVPAASAAAGAGSTAGQRFSVRVPQELKGVLEAAARITATEAQVLLASGSGLSGAR